MEFYLCAVQFADAKISLKEVYASGKGHFYRDMHNSRVCFNSSFMLCSSCQRQPSCLPAKLAETDDTLAEMLNHLQDCNLRPKRTRFSLLHKLSGIFQSLWAGLSQGLTDLTRRLRVS